MLIFGQLIFLRTKDKQSIIIVIMMILGMKNSLDRLDPKQWKQRIINMLSKES